MHPVLAMLDGANGWTLGTAARRDSVRHLTASISRGVAASFLCSQAESTPAPAPYIPFRGVTLTVGWLITPQDKLYFVYIQ